jgi:glycosyltransferase involved in cell wall biosynthesis
MASVLQVLLDLSLASTGVYTTARNFREALESGGDAVFSVSFDRSQHAEESRDFVSHSIRASRLPGFNRFGFSWSAALGYYDDLLDNADIIFAHSLYGYHIDWVACRARPRQRVFIIPHGALDGYCFTYRNIRKRLWLKRNRHFLEERAIYIFSSQYERAEANRFVDIPRSEVLFWPVGAGFLGCQVSDRSGRFADQQILLLVGRLHPMKRTLETVQAFARLARTGWQLHVVGPPSQGASIDDLRQSAGAAWGRTVHYRGALPADQLAVLYQSADGILLLSRRENFANVVAEALTNGCPAFVSDRVGLADEVRARGWGLVFPEGELGDCRAVIERAMEFCRADQPPIRAARQEAARNTFSFQRFQAELLRIQDRALGV